jgi:transposase
MRPYSVAYKGKMVARLSGPGATSAKELERETGIPQQTFSRWVKEARRLPVMPTTSKPTKTWTVDDRIRILAGARGLEGDELSRFLAKEGASLLELEQWRMALGVGVQSADATRKRIRELERELLRKDKALAEAAALLVLKKKLEYLLEAGDDDTDERSGK